MNLSFGSSGEDKENLIIKRRRQRRTIFQKRTTQLFLWHLPLQTLHHPCSPPLGANYYFTSFLHHRAPACTQSSRWDCSRGAAWDNPFLQQTEPGHGWPRDSGSTTFWTSLQWWWAKPAQSPTAQRQSTAMGWKSRCCWKSDGLLNTPLSLEIPL